MARKTSAMAGKTKTKGLYPKQCGFQKEHLHYTTKGDFKKGCIPWNKGLCIFVDKICQGCGIVFPVRQDQIKRGRGKYCSKKCNPIPQIKKIKYKNIWMRSSWEIKYAKYLDSKNIVWKYEFKRFDLGNTTYTPDFYLPETNEYIEIKGWWRGNSKLKFDIFLKLYKDVKITLLMQKDLKKMGVLKCVK